MDGRGTTTRRGVLGSSAGLGVVGTAVIWEADATHYVGDLLVRVESR